MANRFEFRRTMLLAKAFIRAAGGYVNGDPCPHCGGRVLKKGDTRRGPILQCAQCRKSPFDKREEATDG